MNDPFPTEVRLAQAGDRPALDRLLTRLETRFRHDAERQLGDGLRGRTRASDVLQDAYLEVVRRIREFAGDTESEFFGWVRAIIENCARQQYRRMTAKKRKAPTRTSEFNALARTILRASSSPATTLRRAEDVALVHAAIQSLRPEHQIVIERIVLDGQPITQVAQTLGRSEAATRMLLSRARATLTMKLDELHRQRDQAGKTS